MKRVIVRNKQEFLIWVNSFNGKMNCYTTVYDFEHFAIDSKVDSSVILDRMFLDFDAHDQPLTDAWSDFIKIVKGLQLADIKHKIYFSGKGFHIIVIGEKTNDIRSIQSTFAILAKDVNTLDNTGVQTNRLRRIPNTVNLSSKGKNGPYFCIPLNMDDINSGLQFILNKAEKGNQLTVTYGKELQSWNKVKPMSISDIEVIAPKPPGELPILPCLYNSIMVENPGHYARAYLVQWYRDILAIGERELTSEKNKELVEIIMKELEAIASKEEVWLDWDYNVTKKHVIFIVSGGYHAPSCEGILIPQGYCVGKCWRYPK
jgi:hypothetical protein